MDYSYNDVRCSVLSQIHAPQMDDIDLGDDFVVPSQVSLVFDQRVERRWIFLGSRPLTEF